MSYRMPRREFLVGSARAALGVSLLPVVAWAQAKQGLAEADEQGPWENLIADLEKQIPKMMEDALVPGLSIAIIRDAKIAWRRGFGIKDAASKKPVDRETM